MLEAVGHLKGIEYLWSEGTCARKSLYQHDDA